MKVGDVEVRKGGRRNRHRLAIARDVLAIATVRVRRTKIMYQANLSYPLTKKYLNSLLQSGLVELEDSSCYLITARGKEFLQMYAEFLERHRRILEEVSGAEKDKLLLENMAFNNKLQFKANFR